MGASGLTCLLGLSDSTWPFPHVFAQELLTLLSLIREEQQRLKSGRSRLGPTTGLRVSYQSWGYVLSPASSFAEHLPAPPAPPGMVLTGSP